MTLEISEKNLNQRILTGPGHDEFNELAHDKDIQLAVHMPDHLIIQGDKETLTRAYSNLLDNAIKFNVNGGRVEVDYLSSQGTLAVMVSNTGPGVPDADIGKVFDQFYRVDPSRSLQSGGSGLGLAIVKRTVELHNGQISFESKTDDWTRVTMRLSFHHETGHFTD